MSRQRLGGITLPMPFDSGQMTMDPDSADALSDELFRLKMDALLRRRRRRMAALALVVLVIASRKRRSR